MALPALADLMGGYFHQDWDTYGTEDEVVDQFMTDQASLRDLLEPEISRMLGFELPEERLTQIVTDLGAEYDPTAKYGSARAWLEAIRSRAAAFSAWRTDSVARRFCPRWLPTSTMETTWIYQP